LTLTHNQVGYFKPDHLTLLQAIASQSAIAIENAQLYAAERRRVNELVALNQLTREISRFTRSVELWENLPRLARETLRYPAVGLWLVDGDKVGTDHPLTLRGLAGKKMRLAIRSWKWLRCRPPRRPAGPILRAD